MRSVFIPSSCYNFSTHSPLDIRWYILGCKPSAIEKKRSILPTLYVIAQLTRHKSANRRWLFHLYCIRKHENRGTCLDEASTAQERKATERGIKSVECQALFHCFSPNWPDYANRGWLIHLNCVWNVCRATNCPKEKQKRKAIKEC